MSELSHATDQALMARVQAGDTGAFGALHRRLLARALMVARAMGVDPDRVEDVVQEAFLSVWRARASYRADRGRVHAWVFAIVRNRAIDQLREHARDDRSRSGGEERLAALTAPGDVEADTAERDDARALRSMLTKLPLAQREVIALAYFGTLTHREIAIGLEMPLGTVKGRMRLGLNKLRSQIPA